MVSQLVTHFRLDQRSRVIDVGAGTGQVIVPLASRAGAGIAIEPEPDLLQRLRDRRGLGHNVLTVLGTDRDLPILAAAGFGPVDLVTVANALHFMNPADVFANARPLLRPGGGIAIVSHGVPLWLADNGWAREVNRFLQDWLGASTGGQCGVDDRTRADRAATLSECGFVEVTVLHHEYTAQLTPQYVVGHLYSALSETQIPVDRRADFEKGCSPPSNAAEHPRTWWSRYPSSRWLRQPPWADRSEQHLAQGSSGSNGNRNARSEWRVGARFPRSALTAAQSPSAVSASGIRQPIPPIR